MFSLLWVLAVAPVLVDGGLTADEVRDVLRFHDEALDACRGVKPGVEVLSIDADGGVLASDAGCFNQQAASWVFPRRTFGTSAQVTWPVPRDRLVFNGGLSTAALIAMQRAQVLEVAQCFVAHRARPDDTGRFDTRVTVGPSGAVLDVSVPTPASPHLAAEVPACVADRVRAWRFPAAKGSTQASLRWLVVRRPADAATMSDVPFVAVSERDAEPPSPRTAWRAALEAQGSRLRRCLPRGDEGQVAVAWRSTDGGVEDATFFRWSPRAHQATTKQEPVAPPALARCVVDTFATFNLPPGPTGRSAQTWALSTDGGVELLETVPALTHDELREGMGDQVTACKAAAVGGKGAITVAWTITAAGTVDNVRVFDDTTSNPAFTSCVVARVKGWRFAEPVNGGHLNVTKTWLLGSVDIGEGP